MNALAGKVIGTTAVASEAMLSAAPEYSIRVGAFTVGELVQSVRSGSVLSVIVRIAVPAVCPVLGRAAIRWLDASSVRAMAVAGVPPLALGAAMVTAGALL